MEGGVGVLFFGPHKNFRVSQRLDGFRELGLAQGTEKGMAGLGGRSDRDLRDRNSLGVASLGLAHHLISGLKPDGTFQGLGRSGFRLRCS